MKENIKAIHDSEIKEFFERLGIVEKLANGELKCSVCKSTITEQNFRAITKKSEDLLFSCNRESCYTDFLEQHSEVD
jgi:hypothetical protein